MKLLYLTASIIFTVLILILAFENISAQCNSLNFFFYTVDQNPTIVIFGISIIGILTGVFYHAFISKLLAPGDPDEEQTF